MHQDYDFGDVNEPEELGLDQKMGSLLSKSYHFKKQLTRNKIHILNLIAEQQTQSTRPTQPASLPSLISNNSSSMQDVQPNVPEPVKVSKFAKLKPEPISVNRFTSKKRSQFSYYSNDSQNSNLELPIKYDSKQKITDNRKERSKQVRTTIKQYNQQYLKGKIRNTQVRNTQQSLLQFDILQNSSQSSISTPKSILKNPSSHNSSRLSCSSLQVSSQLSAHSPRKGRVKFCLTREQARREHIPC